jgi:DNA invertase Pin-like site-specific DNA recombinase
MYEGRARSWLQITHDATVGEGMADDHRAVIYTRISRDAEGEGTGVERQEASCRELAERLHLPVTTVYSDNDVGASDQTNKKKTRPGYKRLLADARSGAFTHIIAYSNSRLTRRVLELEDLIKLHEETGVIIQTVVSGQDDLSTADGQFVARIKASMDAAESKRISERARAAHRHKALKGEVKRQARRPFGFLADGVTHHPIEAALIREAVLAIIDGATITQIQRQWENARVKTTSGGEHWRWFPLRRVLLGARTAGIREYKGEVLLDKQGEPVTAEWEPIITPSERTQAWAALEARSKKKVRQGNWLLSGLLRCGRCGAPLYGSLGAPKKAPEGSEKGDYERADTYACNTANSHLGITAKNLEDYVERVVYRYIVEKAYYKTPDETPEEVQEWPLEDRLAGVSRKIDELMDAYNSDRLSPAIVFPQLDDLDRKRRDLRQERNLFYAEQESRTRSTDVPFADVLHRYRQLHEGLLEDRQLALQQEVDTIVIGPGLRGNAGKGWDALVKRVTIQWKEPHHEFNGRSAEAAALEHGWTLPGDPDARSTEQTRRTRLPTDIARVLHQRDVQRDRRDESVRAAEHMER